jgi:DNA-binding transcriptional LysR family regulator
LLTLSRSDLIATLPRRLVESQASCFGLASAELPFKRKPDPIQAVATKARYDGRGISWLMKVLIGSATP